MYILNVSRTFGGVECTQSDTIVIDFSPNLLPVTITGGVIGCTQSSTVIAAVASGFGLQYSWSGPEGFTSAIPNPDVSVLGEYTVTVTGGQGCSGTQTVTVTKQEQQVVVITGTTLSCFAPSVITAFSNTQGLNYSWTGQVVSGQNTPSIVAYQSGWYILTTSSLAGCVNITSFWLAPPLDSLVLAPQNDTINCVTNAVSLFCGTNAPFPEYYWIGPNGFTSSFAQPYIEVPGVYSVVITDILSFCSATAEVVIAADTTAPAIDSILAVHPIIGQSNGSIHLAVSGASEPFTYFWTYNGFFFADTEDITGLAAGTYQCVVTAANGCYKILSVELTGTSATNETTNTDSLTLSPNPSDGRFVISQAENTDTPAAMYLYDIAGKLVWQQAEQWISKDHSLDFSNLPAGQYWLRISSAKGTVLLKPIINK